MKVYISLPISGRPLEMARNQADLIAAALSKQGHKPVNPFDVYAGNNPTYEEHLGYDLIALMDCDAIYLTDGWRESRGCRIEAKVAKEFGLKFLAAKGSEEEKRLKEEAKAAKQREKQDMLKRWQHEKLLYKPQKYTAEEVKKMTRMYKQGKSVADIAAALDRSDCTVRDKLKRMGLWKGRGK